VNGKDLSFVSQAMVHAKRGAVSIKISLAVRPHWGK